MEIVIKNEQTNKKIYLHKKKTIDLVTSGTSVLETVDALNSVELKVKDVVVLIDREQGGKDNLKTKNLKLFSVFTISSMISILSKKQKINEQTVSNVKAFLKSNQSVKPTTVGFCFFFFFCIFVFFLIFECGVWDIFKKNPQNY